MKSFSIFILICLGIILNLSHNYVVESFPQGHNNLSEANGEGEIIPRSAEVQALIDACPCFDYVKMCASPPPPDTTTEPSSTDAPTTTIPEEPEPKSLDDENVSTTTVGPNPESSPLPEDEQVTNVAPTEAPAADDQPTTTAATPNDDAPTTTAATPEELNASEPSTTTTEKSDEPTEAPQSDASPTTQAPEETIPDESPSSEQPPAENQRNPKKLDDEPSPVDNEQPTEVPTTTPAAADLSKAGQPAPSNQMNAPTGIDPSALDSLTKLLAELNEKLRKLEESHDNLNKNIEVLENRLKEYEKLIPEVKANTNDALSNSNPEKAVEQWKNLQSVIDDPQELQNVTNDIVAKACQQNVSPPDTMNFIHNLPTTDTTIVDSAYNTLADQMSNNDQLQEQMYWRDMSPYCQAVAQDIGPNSPTTQKMYNLQDEMRKNAAQPIKQCSQQINQQQYDPALNTWNNMTVDIADSPNQLKTNMQTLIIKAYDGDADSLPYVFQFVFILPDSQVEYKDVAFECLRNEMNNNGHSFIYNPASVQNNNQGGSGGYPPAGQQQLPQGQYPPPQPPPPGNVYNYRNY